MSQENNLLIGVVIPTHKRAVILAKVLAALARQDFPANQFEVITVLDGPDEPTEVMLKKSSFPYRFRWFIQPHQGAPAARNLGVKSSDAEVLIFIDDDIVATPEFVRSHYEAHQREPHSVVLGGLKPAPDSPGGFVDAAVDWTQGYFDRCSDPSYKVGGKDMVNPNFSAEKSDILKAGGWDETFEGYGGPDDRDLGLRFERRGLPLRFCAQALGYHNQTKGWADVLRDVRQNGRTLPHYVEKHPEGLNLVSWAASTPKRRLLFRAIRVCPEFAFTLLTAWARLSDKL